MQTREAYVTSSILQSWSEVRQGSTATRWTSLWGAAGTIPEDHVIPVGDRTELRFGSHQFLVLDTPGHAQHHNAYWLESERTVFAGDVAGVRIRGGPVIPPFPPPDIHLESWKESLDKIRALKPASLHITHFGRVNDPIPTLDALEKRLFSWADWMKQRLLEGNRNRRSFPSSSDLRYGNSWPPELRMKNW